MEKERGFNRPSLPAHTAVLAPVGEPTSEAHVAWVLANALDLLAFTGQRRLERSTVSILTFCFRR